MCTSILNSVARPVHLSGELFPVGKGKGVLAERGTMNGTLNTRKVMSVFFIIIII